ncbi:hypothetical protein TL16_g06403 [Triparma laevis f. inornata]|nr:hypothetical protein TL16_g06403 [Triparma laevis f. inornata]
MMKRRRHAHNVIKRSFRKYFFRVYKKQLRRIMNCWRSYWLRHHLKLIQRVYRGVLGRRKARVMKLKVVAAEAVRGARELEAVNNMLLVVELELKKHLSTKAGMKEVKEHAKFCRTGYKESWKVKGVEAGKSWENRMKAKVECWVQIFEVKPEGEGAPGDGFVDINSVSAAIKDLQLGELALLTDEDVNTMIKEIDIFKVGLVNTKLLVGWVGAKVGKSREEERASLKWHERMRKDIRCWSKGIKVRYTWAAFMQAARLRMIEAERRKYYLKMLEAYRSGAQGATIEVSNPKPRVVCLKCQRPFAYHTLQAQRHIKAGGCVERPSKFLPIRPQDMN